MTPAELDTYSLGEALMLLWWVWLIVAGFLIGAVANFIRPRKK